MTPADLKEPIVSVSMLSNGNGSVQIEDDGIARAYRGGVLIGSFTIPMCREDAEMLIRLATHRDERINEPIGLTAEMFVQQDLMVRKVWHPEYPFGK